MTGSLKVISTWWCYNWNISSIEKLAKVQQTFAKIVKCNASAFATVITKSKMVGKPRQKSNMATAKWSGDRRRHFELSTIKFWPLESEISKSSILKLQIASCSFKSGLLLANFPLENWSLCIGWVMTGTRRCLDDYVTMSLSSLGLSRRRNARLYHLHVTFHCPSFKGISKIASTSE